LALLALVNSITTSGRKLAMETKSPRVLSSYRAHLGLEPSQIRVSRRGGAPASLYGVVEAVVMEMPVDLLSGELVRPAVRDLVDVEELRKQLLE